MSNGIGIDAAELVADVLRGDGDRDAERPESLADPRLEQVAEVHLGEPDVPVGVALDVGEAGEVVGIEVERQALGNHGDAVAPAHAQVLDDRSGQRVHDRAELDRVRELLGNDGEARPGGLADAEGQVARGAAHGHHEVPPRGRPGVHDEGPHEIDAVMARRLVPERVDVRRQVEVVVNRLGNVHDPQAAPAALLGLHRGERRVVAANRDELRHVEPHQGADHVVEQGGVPRRVGARGAEDRAPLEVDVTDVGDRQRHDVRAVVLHHPLEPVAQADDVEALEPGADHGRGDDTVDPRGRPTADHDGEFLLNLLPQPDLPLRWM